MKIILALGNPGNEYNLTRHNLGFLTLDFEAKIHSLNWKQNPKFKSITTTLEKTLLAKPQTFYNNTGEAAATLVNFYKINPATDLLIICDDFDLPLGTTRLREKGSTSGNKGLKSITDHLKTTNFHRLRLGTNNPTIRQTLGDTDFVLSKFTPEEREKLPKILKEASEKINQFIKA